MSEVLAEPFYASYARIKWEAGIEGNPNKVDGEIVVPEGHIGEEIAYRNAIRAITLNFHISTSDAIDRGIVRLNSQETRFLAKETVA